jgi:general secretion pathway protein C
MQTNAIHTWGVRAVTFALALLAALSATYWFLKSTQAHSVSIAAPVDSPGLAPLDPQSVARALGGGKTVSTASAASANPGRTPFVLSGVLAEGSHGGAALISVDGKPAKPYVVGASVDGNLVLQSVAGRRATLATSVNGPAQITLELPALSK